MTQEALLTALPGDAYGVQKLSGTPCRQTSLIR